VFFALFEDSFVLFSKKQSNGLFCNFSNRRFGTLCKALTLLEILEDRHGRKSSVFVSQLPVTNWHEVIGDPTIADAICDSIIHNAHRIELKGDSVRKIYANN
jgi:hypothetical protein